MFNANAVQHFYSKAEKPEHRDHSYDYCFDAFAKVISIDIPTSEDLDLAALNLGMFLASWGMYRGSTDLFQKCSYIVHVGAINVLINQKYRSLYKISPADYYGKNIDLILDLFNELSNHYKSKDVTPTDTLITKVLLGTLGCTMALDTYVKSSIGRQGITQKFGKKHLEDMRQYYEENKSEIDAAVALVNNPKYHILKCMDMSFF